MKPLPFLNPAAATPAVRNPVRPALIVPIQATTADELAAQTAAAAETGVVDAVEWRVDPLLERMAARGAEGTGSAYDSPAEAVLALVPHVSCAGLPVLITVRTAFEGGMLEISEADYAEVLGRLIVGLAALRDGRADAIPAAVAPAAAAPVAVAAPMAIDIEIERARSRSLISHAHDHAIPVVASRHDFESTDSREVVLVSYSAMAEAGADVAKVAMMPQSAEDVVRLLAATAEADAKLDCPVLGISMGRLGRTSRIMGADFGSCASFAQLSQASAPGQINAVRLAKILDRVYGQ